jgi:hypothetical protein
VDRYRLYSKIFSVRNKSSGIITLCLTESFIIYLTLCLTECHTLRERESFPLSVSESISIRFTLKLRLSFTECLSKSIVFNESIFFSVKKSLSVGQLLTESFE